MIIDKHCDGYTFQLEGRAAVCFIQKRPLRNSGRKFCVHVQDLERTLWVCRLVFDVLRIVFMYYVADTDVTA